MKVYPLTARLALMGIGLAAFPVLAQSVDPSFALKIHGGLTAGDLQKLHQNGQIFGFGVAGRFPLSATSAFTVELGFDYIPGRDHDALSSGPVNLPQGLKDATGTAIGNRPVVMTVDSSIDWRKESTQGFSLRGTYTDQLPVEGGWYWFAGASLDVYKTNGQFAGTLRPHLVTPVATGVDSEGNPTTSAALLDSNGNNYYEGWALVQDRTKLNFGVLSGVGVPLSETTTFEFTVRNLGFTHLDYKPFTYTGSPAVLEQSTKRGFSFEVGLLLKI